MSESDTSVQEVSKHTSDNENTTGVFHIVLERHLAFWKASYPPYGYVNFGMDPESAFRNLKLRLSAKVFINVANERNPLWNMNE